MVKALITVDKEPSWSEATENLSRTLKQLWRLRPWWTLLAFVLPLLRSLVLDGPSPNTEWIQFILDQLVLFCFGALNLYLVYIYSTSMGISIAKRSVSDRLKIAKMFLLSWTYGLAFVFGLLLLIVPGIWLMVRASLAAPVMCIEGGTALGAFNESLRLTRGHGRLICVNSILPQLIGFAGSILGIVVCILSSPELMSFIFNTTKVTIPIGYLFTLSAIAAVIWTISSIVFAMTQVRLYWYLKSLETPITTIESKSTD